MNQPTKPKSTFPSLENKDINSIFFFLKFITLIAQWRDSGTLQKSQ